MSVLPDDLSEGWPADPENEELARFAEQLSASRPTLPTEALARVERGIQRELAASARGSRRAPLAGLAAAAVLLVGIGVYLLLKPAAPPNRPVPVVEQQPAVHDRYNVELATPPPAVTPERSLVRLDAHRSLFTD